ncbi:hypothetical protein IFR05_012760 [Cadophora sp. M221]|nr:hypothetical protein IFR05_012760 [Cadophora sp. M221]
MSQSLTLQRPFSSSLFDHLSTSIENDFLSPLRSRSSPRPNTPRKKTAQFNATSNATSNFNSNPQLQLQLHDRPTFPDNATTKINSKLRLRSASQQNTANIRKWFIQVVSGGFTIEQHSPFSAMVDEEGEEAPAHFASTKRQRGPEKSGSWASTLPYDGPCFRPSTLPAPSCYLQKLDSPMLSLLVGPERKLFQIHKEMLLQAAHYFTTIFNTNTNNIQSQTQSSSKYPSLSNINTAAFPTDDPTAFELLIQWCYTGKLPSLTRQAQDSVFNIEVTKFCSVRLRLCCLADKYGMVLLHNLAMDSILVFLGSGCENACSGGDEKGMGMGLEWKVFKGWCRYVYEHSSEHSPLRKFITAYFNHAIRSQKSEDKIQAQTQYQNSNHNQNLNRGQNSTQSIGTSKAEETKPSGSKSGYTIEKLHTLANDIPDLMKDLFAFMRLQAFVPRPISRPWDCNPCDFHIHTSRSSSHFPPSSSSSSSLSTATLNREIHVACPMSLVPPHSTWPSPTAKIQYFLQDATLKGTATCYVSQVVEELGYERGVAIYSLRELVDGDVVAWVEFGQSFELAMPRVEEDELREGGSEKGKEKCGVPEVIIFGPEEEDLYSANAGF